MRTLRILLFVALFGASSVTGAAAVEAGWNRVTKTLCHGRGAPLVSAGKLAAAFAFLPPSQELSRMKNSEIAASAAAAAALKVARLAATASLALALISSSPSPSEATEDVAHGSKLFSAECAVCHPDGRNRMNSLKTLHKEALEQYQSLEAEQLVTYVSSQVPHTYFPHPTIVSMQDYDDVIAYVLDQAINNKWQQ